MWHFEQPPAWQSADTTQFLAVVNANSRYFDSKPLQVGRAPGRLDLMGGIADYSGALVLELPLAVATFVAAQLIDEAVFEVFSPDLAVLGEQPWLRLPLETLEAITEQKQLAGSWASYPMGVWLMLQRAYQLPTDRGIRLFIHSEVPVGKGVSSSAALEVATLQALVGLYGLELSGKEAALLCQKAENNVVGAPCGIMDQMSVACGQADHLLMLRCQPAELEGNIKLPPDLAVWGLDSGIRHAVTGADYGSVRVGAFMGYRLVAELAGLKAAPVSGQLVKIEDPLWQGYLANISPSLWESQYQDKIPLELKGAAFLKRWGGTTDPVTQIDPYRTYPLRQATAHPIYENQRVQLFRSLLKLQTEDEASTENRNQLLGELMYQSHQSYSRCGLGSSGTDQLVELVRWAGPASGLYGAKITGGGSGGTVAVLGKREAFAAIKQVVTQYEAETNYNPLILSGSSPGAMAFGSLRLVL